MDTNQNNTWNQEKMGRGENNNMIIHDEHQIPMGVGNWPNYQQGLEAQPSSNVAGCSRNNFLSDVLGIELEEGGEEEEAEEELGVMKEMMYKMAVMQPVDIDPESVRKPKRRNVRISDDPQSVAARHRRERISEKIRILQRLVPGGTKMDTASMLDEAIRYVKFLKRQIRLLQSTPPQINCINAVAPSNAAADSPFAPILLHASNSNNNVHIPVIGMEFDTTVHQNTSDSIHFHQS